MTSKIFKLIIKPLKFNIVIIYLLSFSCNNHNQVSANSQISNNISETWQSTVIQKDTLDPKDLKTLSTFGDTLILFRFQKEIDDFEKKDSLYPNRKVDIVFTGSSSIRKWKSLGNDLKDFKVLNRGFGGSTIPEAIYYSDILIFKHKPKRIVLYAGENDISTTTTDSLKVYQSFVYFHQLIKQKLPDTELYFISIKLSPSRAKYWNSIKSINKMIEQYCISANNCKFIDVNKAMLDSNMQVRTDLYLKDQLHINDEGYQIWSKIIYNSLKMQNK